MKRVKSVFRVKKNRYGNPRISAREALEDGQVLHLHASLIGFEYSIRGPTGGAPVGSGASWENVREHPATTEHLVALVRGIIDLIKAKRAPYRLVPREQFAGVLV